MTNKELLKEAEQWVWEVRYHVELDLTDEENEIADRIMEKLHHQVPEVVAARIDEAVRESRY